MPSVASSSFAPTSVRQRLAHFLGRPTFYLYLTGVLMLLGLLLGHRFSERASLDQLSALATERLELYASNLQTELGRHAYLPSLLAIDGDVTRLIEHPDDDALRWRGSTCGRGRRRSSSPIRKAACSRPASR